MRVRRRLVGGEDEQENVWPSFADLTATIALILFVLVLLAYIQNLISGKNLEFMRKLLDDTALQLESSTAEINRAKEQLRLLEDDAAKTQAEIEHGAQRLKLSEAMVEEQSRLIAESNRELGDLRSRLRGMALLRVDVLERVKAAMQRELEGTRPGNAPLLSVADNGNIVINESLVFEFNSHRVKSEGKPLLDTLSQAFANLLADPQVRSNIDVILVQGHTDERGATSYNRDLSAKRANAVLDYLFTATPSLEDQHGSYFAASAHSEFRPVDTAKTEAAYERNRRIEISVVLKDTQIQQVIDDYLGRIDPLLTPNAPGGAPSDNAQPTPVTPSPRDATPSPSPNTNAPRNEPTLPGRDREAPNLPAPPPAEPQ